MGFDCLSPTVKVDDTFNINLEKAIPFGLIINEIVMNYFKHVANEKGATFKLSIVPDLKKDTYILKKLENKPWLCNYCYHVGLDKLSIN